MLKIVLKDGREFLNDPTLGWNLDTKQGISELLDEGSREYWLTYKKENGNKGSVYIKATDVKEIVEAT